MHIRGFFVLDAAKIEYEAIWQRSGEACQQVERNRASKRTEPAEHPWRPQPPPARPALLAAPALNLRPPPGCQFVLYEVMRATITLNRDEVLINEL